MTPAPPQITQLLIEWRNGKQGAFDQLMPVVYAELHRMAKRYMRRQHPGHTLQTTALIHEAYTRLVGDSGKDWQSRDHFFAVAATAMRHVLVDYARASQSAKRGGASPTVSLDEALVVSGERKGAFIALDDALVSLAKLNPRQAEVVDLRFFGGLSVEQTAATLNVSPETVMRDWRAAKAWLYRELGNTQAVDEHGDDA
jgi:RNA polymerase sigma-70 factor (ECF subfamily)